MIKLDIYSKWIIEPKTCCSETPKPPKDLCWVTLYLILDQWNKNNSFSIIRYIPGLPDCHVIMNSGVLSSTASLNTKWISSEEETKVLLPWSESDLHHLPTVIIQNVPITSNLRLDQKATRLWFQKGLGSTREFLPLIYRGKFLQPGTWTPKVGPDPGPGTKIGPSRPPDQVQAGTPKLSPDWG